MATKPPSKPPAKKDIKKPAKAEPEKTVAGTSKESAARKVALFIDAYLLNGNNAAQAAITAGYSAKTARAAGHRLLTRVDVKKQVEDRSEKVAEKLGLSLERTLQEIARLAYADPRKMFNADGSLKKVHELDDDTAATVASIEVDEIVAGGVVLGNTRKMKTWDKNHALEKAMKFHGAYERDNKQKQPVVLQVTSTDEEL